MPAVLFAWRRYPPPFLIGGAEVSQRLLAEEFVHAGWQVTYLGSHEAPWNGVSTLDVMRHELATWGVDFVHDQARGELRYRWNGIDCLSVPQAALFLILDALLRAGPPDLVVTSQEGSAVLAKHASKVAPVAGWIHSVSRTGMEVLAGAPQYALAVSRFVLSRMRTARDTKALLCYPPFVRTSTGVPDLESRPDDLLMVNPVPAKGARLMRELVQLLPERQFTLVEGWWDTSAQFAGLVNVRYIPRTYTMNRLYERHRLLLVPSVVEDAFPRVIIEAGQAGLPAIGADRGGIAEAIQDGGVVVGSRDAAAWASIIRSLNGSTWTDLTRRAQERSAQLARSCLTELKAAGVVAAT